jgi:hypothetical protein
VLTLVVMGRHVSGMRRSASAVQAAMAVRS